MDDYIVHRLILAEYALECGSWANSTVNKNNLIQDYDKLESTISWAKGQLAGYSRDQTLLDQITDTLAAFLTPLVLIPLVNIFFMIPYLINNALRSFLRWYKFVWASSFDANLSTALKDNVYAKKMNLN